MKLLAAPRRHRTAPAPYRAIILHVIILSTCTCTMDGPKQAFEAHSELSTRVFERSRSEEELRDISEESNYNSGTHGTDTESKDKNKTQPRSEVPILAGLYQKLSAFQWRNAFTLFVVVVNYFLVNGSISLIATFFPRTVN